MHVGLLPPPRRLCFHLCLSVCLLTGLLKNYWWDLCEILWNGWTKCRDQSIRFWVTLTQGQVHLRSKVKIFFLQIIPFKIVIELWQKLKCSLFNLIAAIRLIVSKIVGGQRSGSGHSEIDLPWWWFALFKWF